MGADVVVVVVGRDCSGTTELLVKVICPVENNCAGPSTGSGSTCELLRGNGTFLFLEIKRESPPFGKLLPIIIVVLDEHLKEGYTKVLNYQCLLLVAGPIRCTVDCWWW